MRARILSILTLLLIATAVLAAGCVAADQHTPAAPTNTTSTPTMLTGVPDVRQAEYYSCGAGAMQAVLGYYGIDSFESDLRGMLNTTPGHGTYPWDMVRVAQELGLKADWKANLTLADLQKSISEGVPVITDSQRLKETNKTWNDTWKSGHYMVLIGIDNRNVTFEDPFLLGSRLTMDRNEFVDSWHDYEAELSNLTDDNKYQHVGVFIRGTPPQDRPAVVWPERLPTLVPHYVPNGTPISIATAMNSS